MKAVILAAGQGTRLRPLTETDHKCMLPYQGTPVIERMVTQLKSAGITDIYIVTGYKKDSIMAQLKAFDSIHFVENKRYREDTNIYSMLIAIDAAFSRKDDEIVIIEADMIFEDALVRYVVGADFENQSVWFTSGRFNASQYGGILRTNGSGLVEEIKIVPSYSQEYENWDKLTGMMRVSSQELPIFQELLRSYASEGLDQYYLVPWMENVSNLPSVRGDASKFKFATFNTHEDYRRIQNMVFDVEYSSREIELVDVEKLKPIEDYDVNRISAVREAVVKGGFWTQPLVIERDSFLVLDGHHRLELAKNLGLKRLPVIRFDYSEVDIWTLKEEIPIDKNKVIANAISGRIYPYKTVKHKFPHSDMNCKIDLGELS